MKRVWVPVQLYAAWMKFLVPQLRFAEAIVSDAGYDSLICVDRTLVPTDDRSLWFTEWSAT